MQEEVQKAIKIHQANKVLQDKIKELQKANEVLAQDGDNSQLQNEYNEVVKELQLVKTQLKERKDKQGLDL